MWKPALHLLPLLLLPLPLLFASVAVDLPPAHRLFLDTLPWLVGLVVILLSLGFKQSRTLLVALHLAAFSGLLHLAGTAAPENPAGFILYILLGLTWPLLQGWIILMPERRTLSRIGLVRIAGVLGIYMSLALVWQYQPMSLTRLLPVLPSPFIEQLAAQLSISPAVFWWQLAGLLIMAGFSLWQARQDRLINLTLNLCVLLSLIDTTSPVQSHLYHLFGQLVLLTAVIRNGYDMAFVDTLTGIPGRRALEYYLISPGRGYSIAMLDIDHFKQFNDRYGHDIGDQVLRMVASQLRYVGAGGRLFRYGGEEFTIVFRHGARDIVLAELEKVRERVAQYPMRIRSANRPVNNETGRSLRSRASADQTVSVTLSIGFSTQNNNETTEAVIKQADQALYAAKRAGRNCIRCAQQPVQKRKRRSRTDFARHALD